MVRGIEGLKQVVTMYRTGYPDLVFKTEDLIAEKALGFFHSQEYGNTGQMAEAAD